MWTAILATSPFVGQAVPQVPLHELNPLFRTNLYMRTTGVTRTTIARAARCLQCSTHESDDLFGGVQQDVFYTPLYVRSRKKVKASSSFQLTEKEEKASRRYNITRHFFTEFADACVFDVRLFV